MTNLESFVQEVEATEGKDDTDNLLKAETLLREMGKVKNQKEVWNIIRKNVNKEFTQLPSETQQNLLDACLGAFDLVQKSNDNFELTTSTDSKLNSNQSSFLDKVKAGELKLDDKSYRTDSERALLGVLCLYDLIKGRSGILERKANGDKNDIETTIEEIRKELQPKQEAKQPETANEVAPEGKTTLTLDKSGLTNTGLIYRIKNEANGSPERIQLVPDKDRNTEKFGIDISELQVGTHIFEKAYEYDGKTYEVSYTATSAASDGKVDKISFKAEEKEKKESESSTGGKNGIEQIANNFENKFHDFSEALKMPEVRKIMETQMGKLKGQLDELANSNDAKMITNIFQGFELPKDLGRVIDKLLDPASNKLTESGKAMQKILYQTFSLLQKAFEETAMGIKRVQDGLPQTEQGKLNLLVGWQEALADANCKFAGLISREEQMGTILKLVRDHPNALANYFENQVHKGETQAKNVLKPMSIGYEYTDDYEQRFDKETENIVKSATIDDLPDRLGEVLTHYQPCVIKHDEKHDEIVYFNKRQLQQQGFLKDGGILKENQDQILLHARQKGNVGGFSLSSMVDRLYDNPNFLVMSEQDMRAASDSDQQSRLNKLATNELSETPDEKYFFDASSIDKKLPVGSPKDKQKMRNEVIGAEPLVIKNGLLESSTKKATHGIYKIDCNGDTTYTTEKNLQKLYKNYAEKLDRNETTAFATNRSAEKANLTLESKKLFLQEFGIEEEGLKQQGIGIEKSGGSTIVLNSPDKHPFSIDMSKNKGGNFTLKFKLAGEQTSNEVVLPKAEAILAFARTAKLLDLHGKLSTVRNQKVANQTKERTDLLVSLAENAATLIKDGSAADYRIDNLRRDEKGKTIS